MPVRAQVAQCTNGNCIATCLSPALTQCLTGSGPFCANLQTDPNYCGNCATSCPSDQNNRGTRVCTAGVRAPRCAGFDKGFCVRMESARLLVSELTWEYWAWPVWAAHGGYAAQLSLMGVG